MTSISKLRNGVNTRIGDSQLFLTVHGTDMVNHWHESLVDNLIKFHWHRHEHFGTYLASDLQRYCATTSPVKHFMGAASPVECALAPEGISLAEDT